MIGRFSLATAALAIATVIAGTSTLVGTTSPAAAQAVESGLAHPASAYYRSRGARAVTRGPQVRGFAQRRVGGYSYYRGDTINTSGDSRNLYGSGNSFRDAQFGRQTRFGPLDHGFFFDSGIAPRGGFSPYQN